MIDLHIHTTASDGQYSPHDIIEVAKEKGITILSITDHDSIAGIKEAREAARENHIRFISGIEISVEGNRELHILGYGIDEDNRRLRETCDLFKKDREQRKYRVIQYLEEYNIYLSLAEVEKYTNGGLVGRPHFARAMVDKGYVKNTREAFDLYLGIPAFDKIERPKLSAKEGIELILRAEGVPVLAHPKLLKLNRFELEELLKKLISYGLRGIEAYYSLHDAADMEFYKSLAEKYSLIATGGTDFHGEKVKSNIEMGTGIEYSFDFQDQNIIRKIEKSKIGKVYWITGLSGAGKTTIGKALYQKIKETQENVVLLDGDSLREAFGKDLGYSLEERRKCAMRYSRLCKLLSDQGLIVICCTISMFDQVRMWNRNHIYSYIEIYVKVKNQVLIRRNQKGMYDKSLIEDKKIELVGFNIEMEEPKNPDIVIENDGCYLIDQCVSMILEN